ncbi:MAG TPA: BCAM0308 family protein [Nitrospirota bacterium]|nr:BCAM0308 family protein [Nitrospirota bacterium]
MRTMSRPYQLQYKKKIATSDTYLPRGASQSASVCGTCHAVYQNKRWYADEALYETTKKNGVEIVCPACLKIRDDFPGGIVTLKGEYVAGHKQELLNLIRNEEERARGFNPLERVMSVRENGSGSLVIFTTNEKLAQRLGRAINKSFHGELSYNWSHDNKLVRVGWERAA